MCAVTKSDTRAGYMEKQDTINVNVKKIQTSSFLFAFGNGSLS